MDDGEGIIYGVRGREGVESGEWIYSKSPVGVMIDRVICIF